MIYIDTSVLLAEVLLEDRHPTEAFWNEPLISSRLLKYEAWTCLNRLGAKASQIEAARLLLDRIALIEMHAPALERALEPLPVPVRTLDAMHLATMDFLKQQGQPVRLASYDDRLITAARAMDFAIAPL